MSVTRHTRAELDLLQAWRAGCLALRYTRRGVLVGLYDAAEADIDADAGKYATVCEEHSTTVGHASKRMALAHLSDSRNWCDYCRGPEYGAGGGTTASWQQERNRQGVEATREAEASSAEGRTAELRAARRELARQALAHGFQP